MLTALEDRELIRMADFAMAASYTACEMAGFETTLQLWRLPEFILQAIRENERLGPDCYPQQEVPRVAEAALRALRTHALACIPTN